MKSYEVIKKSVAERGVKAIASEMKVSPSLVYKWAESNEGPDSAGSANPLDRVLDLCRLTDSNEPLRWLCTQMNGYFVENQTTVEFSETYPLRAVQKILRDFSQLLEVVSSSIEDDDVIDEKEAIRIREEWDDLKSKTESFVRSCEKGHFS